MVSWILPWILITLAPLAAMFWLMHHLFALTSRELRRLDGVLESPHYSLHTETMSGVISVRAFAARHQFKNLLEKWIDWNQRAFQKMFFCWSVVRDIVRLCGDLLCICDLRRRCCL